MIKRAGSSEENKDFLLDGAMLNNRVMCEFQNITLKSEMLPGICVENTLGRSRSAVPRPVHPHMRGEYFNVFQ